MAEVKVEDATQDGADPLAPSPEEQKGISYILALSPQLMFC